MENSKIYSRNKLSQMMDQNESEVDELMGIFIRMVPPMLDEMSSFAAVGDWKGVGDIAHKLKSSMRLWDMKTLDEDIVFIESNAQDPQDGAFVLGKIVTVKNELLNAVEEMKIEIQIS